MAELATLARPYANAAFDIAKGDAQFENLLRNYLHAFEKSGLLPRLREKWFEDNSWIATLP